MSCSGSFALWQARPCTHSLTAHHTPTNQRAWAPNMQVAIANRKRGTFDATHITLQYLNPEIGALKRVFVCDVGGERGRWRGWFLLLSMYVVSVAVSEVLAMLIVRSHTKYRNTFGWWSTPQTVDTLRAVQSDTLLAPCLHTRPIKNTRPWWYRVPSIYT